ncbi:hypothetical protein [Fontivita pretiosa]|uniref:hypothetical protein n=1 Tax=Fontivita pretiosa TaxID=2989684 RepID=UPI003D1796B7
MRRMMRLFFRDDAPPATAAWQLSPQQQQQVLELLSQIGLGIVSEARGPVPLLTFGRRVLERLRMHPAEPPVPLPHFADALKRVIRQMDHQHLRVLSPNTDFPGVGYVYNADDPETWPVRSSR